MDDPRLQERELQTSEGHIEEHVCTSPSYHWLSPAGLDPPSSFDRRHRWFLQRHLLGPAPSTGKGVDTWVHSTHSGPAGTDSRWCTSLPCRTRHHQGKTESKTKTHQLQRLIFIAGFLPRTRRHAKPTLSSRGGLCQLRCQRCRLNARC